jgi:hypothetical protein
MGERVYLVVDGIDGRVHHMEFKDPARIEEVGRNMIVEAVSVVSGPRPADRNIAANAEEDNGIYRPNRHLERVCDSFERQGKAPRLSCVPISADWRRCAGPATSSESMPTIGRSRRTSSSVGRPTTSAGVPTGCGYGRSRPSASTGRLPAMVRLGATDRLLPTTAPKSGTAVLVARSTKLSAVVLDDLWRGALRLLRMAMFASLSTPWRLLSDRRSIASASRMARERGLTFVSTSAGEYVSGRLAGVASLVSGRFAMIENGLGFQLVPWQPLLEKRIGQHIAGLQRDDGGIEWTLGRNPLLR